jgi:hypothetical protein
MRALSDLFSSPHFQIMTHHDYLFNWLRLFIHTLGPRILRSRQDRRLGGVSRTVPPGADFSKRTKLKAIRIPTEGIHWQSIS